MVAIKEGLIKLENQTKSHVSISSWGDDTNEADKARHLSYIPEPTKAQIAWCLIFLLFAHDQVTQSWILMLTVLDLLITFSIFAVAKMYYLKTQDWVMK